MAIVSTKSTGGASSSGPVIYGNKSIATQAQKAQAIAFADPSKSGPMHANPTPGATVKTVTQTAPKVAKELTQAILSAGAPKSNNSGITVQQSSQSLSGTSAPSYSSITVPEISSNADMLERLIQISQANTAKEQEFAQAQMDFQKEQNAKAMAFNQAEAQKNRDWQELMSNTAHQREVADMMAAGINPVLSVTGGNGATVTSGATASGVTSAGAKGSVDTGITSALASMFGALINAQSMENVARISANSAQAVAGINAGSAANVANINNAHQEYMTQHYPNNLVQLANAFLSGAGYDMNSFGKDVGKAMRKLSK